MRTDDAEAPGHGCGAAADIRLARDVVKVQPLAVARVEYALGAQDDAVLHSVGEGIEDLAQLRLAVLAGGLLPPARKDLVGVMVVVMPLMVVVMVMALALRIVALVLVVVMMVMMVVMLVLVFIVVIIVVMVMALALGIVALVLVVVMVMVVVLVLLLIVIVVSGRRETGGRERPLCIPERRRPCQTRSRGTGSAF